MPDHDARTRLGFLVPARNVPCEYEFTRTVPDGVSCHFSRLARAQSDLTAESIVAMMSVAEEASGLLAGTGVSVVGAACTSGSFLDGHDGGQVLAQRVSKGAGGVAAFTTTQALHAAFINALRAALYEYGHVVPQGIRQIGRIEEILEASHSDLPDLMRDECRDLLEQIAEQTVRIYARTEKIKALAAEADTARRLQTIPGVGPMTALAVEAFAPSMASFNCGRAFAAWLGLVPRQFSSGGKERLGRTSKAGQADIRRLLIIGAMSRLNWMGRKSIPEDSWLARITSRKPRMLVAIALANKMARTMWAMLTKNQDYRVPAQAGAA